MIIRNDRDRDAFIAKAKAVDLSKQPWEFTAAPWKPNRSLAQNRLSFMWYRQIGQQTADGEDLVRLTCKFNFGCPLLCEVDKDFAEFYDQLINSYNYEQCVQAMRFVDVTSSKKFKVKIMAEYLNRVEAYAAERGCELTHPEDLYHEAMGREYATE